MGLPFLFGFFSEFDNGLKKRVVPHQAFHSGPFVIQLIQYLIEAAVLLPDKIFLLTRTLSKKTSPQASLPVISIVGRTVMPGSLQSITNSLIPFCFGSDRVGTRHKIEMSHITGATGPHFLSVDNIIIAVFYRSGLERSQVEPASGSLIPKPTQASPLRIFGNISCFCSSVP